MSRKLMFTPWNVAVASVSGVSNSGGAGVGLGVVAVGANSSVPIRKPERARPDLPRGRVDGFTQLIQRRRLAEGQHRHVLDRVVLDRRRIEDHVVRVLHRVPRVDQLVERDVPGRSLVQVVVVEVDDDLVAVLTAARPVAERVTGCGTTETICGARSNSNCMARVLPVHERLVVDVLQRRGPGAEDVDPIDVVGQLPCKAENDFVQCRRRAALRCSPDAPQCRWPHGVRVGRVAEDE